MAGRSIATEGSLDTHILEHALSLLRPGIKDFFRFIDMRDGHPFPGTGNLVRFARGLAKIDVHNQVVFLLDNDAEGMLAYKEIQSLSLPPNMRATHLPPLDELRAIPARGPEGVSPTDIDVSPENDNRLELQYGGALGVPRTERMGPMKRSKFSEEQVAYALRQ